MVRSIINQRLPILVGMCCLSVVLLIYPTLVNQRQSRILISILLALFASNITYFIQVRSIREDESSQIDKQAQTSQADLSNIIQIQNAIALAELDLEMVMNTIVERVQSLTQADGAAIELLEADEIVYRAGSGTAASFVGLRLKANASLSGQCVQTGEILSCEDSEIDARVDRDACRRVNVCNASPKLDSEPQVH